MKSILLKICRMVLTLMLMTGWLMGPVFSSTAYAESAEWSVPMTAETDTEGSNPYLVFGTNTTASDSYDSGIDLPHPPPAPGVSLTAYFEIVDPFFSELDRDYRAPASSIQWTLLIESDSEDSTLSWDASGVPANILLSLTETGLNVDMKAGSSTVLSAGVHTLTITASIAPLAVTTVSSTDVSYTQATLNGYLDSLGADDSVLVSFVYGETQSGPYPNETDAESKTAPGAYSAALTGLSPDTTYYFKAKAAGTLTVFGTELSFKTPATIPPEVATIYADKVGATLATLNGKLASLGTATTVDVSFMWGTASGDLTNETTPVTMDGQGGFSFKLTDISANTTYYYLAKAVGDGTSSGNEMSFTTLTSGCFIATAAYGSYMDSNLDILRSFRDEYLITNSLGQEFVNFYYANSPPVASFITENSWLKPVVRAVLMPAVVMSSIALKITLVGELVIIGVLIIAGVALAVWMRKRRYAAG